MDTIKLATLEGREFTFVGLDFQAMLQAIKGIPGAKFVGTVREYGEMHTSNHWDVPYLYADVYRQYGPFEAFHSIATELFDGRTHHPSREEIAEFLATRPSHTPLRIAYRLGRDGLPENESQNKDAHREYLEGCRIRLETDLYRGEGDWRGTWRKNANTDTYQMPLEQQHILTIEAATMWGAISERIHQEHCTLDEAYRAEFADTEKWLGLAQDPHGAYIIDVAADEAWLRSYTAEYRSALEKKL